MRRRVRIATTARARSTFARPEPGQAQPSPIDPTGAPWPTIPINPSVAARTVSRQPPSEQWSILQRQVGDRRAFAAFAGLGDFEPVNQSSLGEVVPNDLAQDAGALSVNDPHGRQPRHVSIVEITV